jgi:hypothetical protein
MKSILLAVAISITAVAAFAATDQIEKKAGFVDLNLLGDAYGEPRVSIDLGSSLLRIVSAAAHHEDPVAGKALRNLESLRIQVYDTHGETDAAAQGMTSAHDLLASQSWEHVVRVREPDNRVDIFVKQDDSLIQGLAIMVLDDEEAVFINVLGAISPEELMLVMDGIDMDLDIDLDI